MLRSLSGRLEGVGRVLECPPPWIVETDFAQDRGYGLVALLQREILHEVAESLR